MSLHCSLILPTLLLLLLLLCLWSSSLLRLLFFAPAVGTLNVRLPCACSSLAALRSIVGTRAQLTHQWAHSCDIWGNSLNEYWQGRAVAAAAGVPFVAHGVACGMLAELPNKLQPADESTLSFACAPICSGCSHLPHSSHLCSGGWRLMLDVVQNDMHAAMLRWQARRKSGIPCEGSALIATWPESMPTEAGVANRVEARTDTGRSVGDSTADRGGPHAGQSAQESWNCAEAYDVAIHFRCGDIRRRCGYDAYGLLTHEYYTRAMQALGLAGMRARVLIVTNAKAHLRRRRLQQLPRSQDTRRPPVADSADCSLFVQALAAHLKRDEIGARRVSVSSESVSADFASLALAPRFIGALSTFSLWAALARARTQDLQPPQPSDPSKPSGSFSDLSTSSYSSFHPLPSHTRRNASEPALRDRANTPTLARARRTLPATSPVPKMLVPKVAVPAKPIPTVVMPRAAAMGPWQPSQLTKLNWQWIGVSHSHARTAPFAQKGGFRMGRRPPATEMLTQSREMMLSSSELCHMNSSEVLLRLRDQSL